MPCFPFAPSPSTGEGESAGRLRVLEKVPHPSPILPVKARVVLVSAALLLAAGPAPLAHAGDIAAGREKAKVCAPCHGLDGLSKAMNAANIAGQLELYLVEQPRTNR
jgi:mono/diheme cytochrome c family protein